MNIVFFRLFLGVALFAGTAALASNQSSQYCAQLAGGEQIISPFDQIRQLRKDGRQNDMMISQIQEAIERKLLRGEIHGGMKRLPNGENNPHKINLGNGIFAVYKPVIPDRPFKMYGEAAAYRISKALRLDIVPPTVIRKIDGVLGSVQLFVPNAKTLLEIPNYPWRTKQSGRWLKVFDWLIKNHDRGDNYGNTMISAVDGEVIGVDHGKIFVEQNIEARRPPKRPSYTMEDLNDPELYARFQQVSEADLTRAMETIEQRAIDELLVRFRILKADFKTLFP